MILILQVTVLPMFMDLQTMVTTLKMSGSLFICSSSLQNSTLDWLQSKPFFLIAVTLYILLDNFSRKATKPFSFFDSFLNEGATHKSVFFYFKSRTQFRRASLLREINRKSQKLFPFVKMARAHRINLLGVVRLILIVMYALCRYLRYFLM